MHEEQNTDFQEKKTQDGWLSAIKRGFQQALYFEWQLQTALLENMNLRFYKATCLFLLIYSWTSVPIQAQRYKHLDRFRSKIYYASIIDGQGSLKDTSTQDGGLCVSYQFEKGSRSTFSLMRNYDRASQDYSFQAEAFSLELKGGHPEDRIRLRLWEDINQNGMLDTEDEVFASKALPLGGQEWHELRFPMESFTRQVGKGNHQPDLNRIRAWDIFVESGIHEKHSGKIAFNDLRFYSSYQAQPSSHARLTGTFVTLSRADSSRNGFWHQDRWNAELRKMSRMGLRKIIVQYSVHQYRAWYTPCQLPFVRYQDSSLYKIFAAAEPLGIKVYLGLSFSETWSKSDKASESTYSELLKEMRANIDELYDLFGSKASFAGWYIPQEINDYDWQTKETKQLLFQWLQQLSHYAHAKNASKKVAIAPFCNLWQPADVVEAWYNEMLDKVADIDCIYLQDGVGTSHKSAAIDLPHYGMHVRSACLKHQREFGTTVESFRQVSGWPIDHGTFSAKGSHLKQLEEQIQGAYQLNPEEIIMFEWSYLIQD